MRCVEKSVSAGKARQVMSNVNIKRAIENIRANTTVYTPIVEAIVNAIQAIDCKSEKDGEVRITVHRSKQQHLDGSLPEIHSFDIWDNGIGFNDNNREAFDTLYTDQKIVEGGKGFGRFTCLKYFENVYVESVYCDDTGCFMQRRFAMGKQNNIIVDEKISECAEHYSHTLVRLRVLKNGKAVDKRLETIAKNLAERLLPYFISDNYKCPNIVLEEEDGTESFILNDFINNKLSAVIVEIPTGNGDFTLKGIETDEHFSVRVFKIVYPKNQKSRISLVAHKREVTGSALYKYVPEFSDDFYENNSTGDTDHSRNYIIKAYVFSSYLDQNVSLERGGFDFAMERDLLHGIGQVDIEQKVALIAKDAVGTEINIRQEKKKERVHVYVDEEAPWHKEILDTIDLSEMPYKPNNEDIEIRLQQAKFAQEMQIKSAVNDLLVGNNLENQKETASEIVNKISGTGRNDLVHYIALRKSIIDIFEKSLELSENGKYAPEGIVHDIIFPRKGDTDITPFKDHNLWLVDERLNFTHYISSDKPLNGPHTDRPDLLVYNRGVVFRGDNEASNPVTIFEFKRPQRDDFVNPSSDDDPVEQIVRYVNDIRDGKYTTPEGRRINVAANTPFYGYVVCDLTSKVETWLEREKDFRCMPDGLGWFDWRGNINLYMEVNSWEKVLKDAKMRNAVFFQTLGI